MALTNAEKQRAYKERLYAAGYKQVQVWVLRKDTPERVDRTRFIRELDGLAVRLTGAERKRLYKDLLEIIQARKEGRGKK
jgi:hypothetical protein